MGNTKKDLTKYVLEQCVCRYVFFTITIFLLLFALLLVVISCLPELKLPSIIFLASGVLYCVILLLFIKEDLTKIPSAEDIKNKMDELQVSTQFLDNTYQQAHKEITLIWMFLQIVGSSIVVTVIFMFTGSLEFILGLFGEGAIEKEKIKQINVEIILPYAGFALGAAIWVCVFGIAFSAKKFILTRTLVQVM
ncbi:hypothetical protein [Canibacter oris]|uniref:Uncharacterized protein n=1 Tax=Canibacter oris TaxID=1365628 RepID=A0A840DNG8_9MICO|nr:hypothetical protein [Canibacter oris]MBB4071089.1 hypothetical protein [Canibacter oris]